jgi:hypothetical protein
MINITFLDVAVGLIPVLLLGGLVTERLRPRDDRQPCARTGRRVDYVHGSTQQREENLMAVVVSTVAPGLTADMYEAVSAKAMSGDQLPEGCHVHIAGPVDQGWRVITVWDSREMFDRFREEKLLPAIRELAGGEGPPDVKPEVNPVHRLLTA